MPGSPILAAHIAEIQRKKKKKEEAAKKANAKTATQKASSAGVTAIVNKGIKDAGGVAGSTLSSIKKPSGILSAANTNHSSIATGSAILAKRIAKRKALSEQHKRQVQSAAQRHDGMTTTEFANKNNAPTVQSPYKTTGGSFTNQEREDLIAYLSTLPEDQKNQYIKSIVATDGLTDQSYNLITNTISSMSSDQQVELAKIVMNSPGSSIYNPSKKAQDIFKMLSPEVQANVIKSMQESIQQSAEENNSTGKMLVAESQKIAADRMDKIKEERASKNGVAKFWDDLNLYLDAAWTGAAGVDSGIIGFIQMLNENVGNEDGPVLDYLKSWQDKYKNKINEQNLVAEATDKSTAVDISRAVGRLAMDVPFTFFGGGTTAAAKEAPAMIKAIKALGAPFQNAATAERAITYAGTRYDEARSYGASVEEATKASLIYALPQAYLESLGGVDKVVNTLLRTGMAPKKILSSIATGAISEGIEEGGQQVWESGSKTLYGKDIPMYSNRPGIDAWINPSMIKESAFLGAVLGGFFGGGITVANNGIFKLVKDDDTSTLSAIENDIKDNLSSGKINEKSADALMKEVNQAKAIYDIVQSKTMVDSKGKTDGYVSDGTLTKDQADSLWRVVSAQAAENGDREIPTYNIGDIIQFDGEDAKVISIVEEDDGKKYFVDIDGQQDVITEDELVAEQQKIVSDTAIQQDSEEIPTQNKIDETDIDTAWNDLKEQYGTWKNGQAPQQINNMQVVSQFVDNALANVENPAIRQALIERVLAGGLTHEAYTDERVQQDLNADRTVLGEEAVNAQMRNDAETVKNINTKKLVTAAIQELVDAVNDGDSSSALYLAQLMADVGTKFGQGSQAFSQLKKLTPAGRVLYAQQQLNADYKKKYGYAPEAIKADIETNVKGELPSLVTQALDAIEAKDSYDESQIKVIINAINTEIEKLTNKGNDRKPAKKSGKKNSEDTARSSSVLADAVAKRMKKRLPKPEGEIDEDADVDETNIDEDAQNALIMLRDLVERYEKRTDDVIPVETEEKPVKRFLEDIQKSIKNMDLYQKTWAEAKKELLEKYKGDYSKTEYIEMIFGNKYDPIINQDMLNKELKNILEDHGITYDDLAAAVYSEESLDDFLLKRFASDKDSLNKVKDQITSIVHGEVDNRRSKLQRTLFEQQKSKRKETKTKANTISLYGNAGMLTDAYGRSALETRLGLRKKNKIDVRSEAVPMMLSGEYYDTQYNTIKNELLEKYKAFPETVDYINTLFQHFAPNLEAQKMAAKVVNQAIRGGNVDIIDLVKKGHSKETVLALTRYAWDGKYNLDESTMIDVYGAIWEEVNRRVISYRESLIENMLAKTGKNKRKNYLERLLEYNNIGAFDDPDQAALILNKMNLPFLTQEDFQFITETAEKAQQLPADSWEQKVEYAKIDKLLNEKKKHTVLQKIRTIQITGMLLSPRTMERNVVPNIAMATPNAIGDIFGTVLDKQIAKKTGQRTMGNAASPVNTLKDMKSGVVNAYKDIKEGVDTSLAGNRDNVPIGDVFSNGNIFGRTMNRASKAVTFGLQLGDRPFEEAYYNNSLRRQMEANGVTEPTQIMKDIAYKTATQRTWKDESAIAQGLQKAQYWLNERTGSRDFGLGSILIPFVKTPSNLVKALYDYSPASIATITHDLYRLRKSDPGTDEQIMAQFNLVNHVSKAVGGTFIMAIAFALAKAGLIELTGAGDDNQDREKYKEEVLGWQPYSIKIGDKYYSYSWVQPFASFLGAGADINANLKEPENQGDNVVETIANSLTEAFVMSNKMIYEQTVLQGISKLFSQDTLVDGLLEILVSAPQQFIPALVGQFAAFVDPYKRQTYTPPEGLSGYFNNAKNGVVNRIPFASMTLPAKTNAMGEKMERFPGGVGSNFLNSFFNPAQVSQEKSNAVTDEIDRLEKATNEKLYPNSADNTVEVGTKTITLTGKEKQAWNKSVGGDFKAAVKELMNSDFYAEMTDDQKAKAISKIHEDINAIYKNEFLNKKDAGIPLESEYQKIKDAKDKYNISVAEFVAVKSGLNQIANDDGDYDAARKRDFVLNFCEGKGYSDEATVYMMDNLVFQNSTSVKNQAESLLVNANIPILDTYKAYSFYEKTISTTDNRTAISGLSTFIAEQAPNLTQEQRKLLGETIVNVIDPYGYFEQIVVKMSGDPEADSTAALSKTMKKLLGQAADLGLTKDEFIYAYSYFKKVDNNASPESFARQIDKLNISADAKRLLTKARWVDVGDYAFRDGGEIEIKGYKLGTDIDLSERIDGRTKGGNTMAEYVPPSARESGVPNVVYKKPSNGKYMTVIAGEYKVTEEKIGGVKTGERAVFETEAGSAVVSPLGGKIVSVKRNSYIGGITVTVKYSDGTFGTYDGLADVNVKADDKVKPGQRIGSSSESVTFLYKDKTGTIKTPSTVFNIVNGSGSIESTSDYFPTKTAEIHDNFKAFSSGWHSYGGWGYGGYGGWGYGGYGGGGSSILSSLIGKKHSSYSRYGYGGWPTFSYTGNENKKS